SDAVRIAFRAIYAVNTAAVQAWYRAGAPAGQDWAEAARAAERRAQGDLLRDVFGYLFRPPAVVPPWRRRHGGPGARLAAAVHDERAYDRLPILADALEDAGCADADILEHCRSGGEHVRGCWVVDLLLGKE